LFMDRLGIDVDPDHELIYTNAQRILEACEPVAVGGEQPGDLIFFEGTYPTSGASHVGIVKDPERGIMLDDHDRDEKPGPGETVYHEQWWRRHFLAFGRVKRPPS
jgi:peptidoglycan DL-endopeptidase CwlO